MNIINPLIAFVLGLISGLIVFMLIRLRIERKSKSLANKKGLIEKAERKTYEGDLEKLDLIKLNPPKDSQDAYYDSKEIFITFRERDMFPFGRNSHTPASNPIFSRLFCWTNGEIQKKGRLVKRRGRFQVRFYNNVSISL